jgi:uncharacterized protein YneF (UPF0154 family)
MVTKGRIIVGAILVIGVIIIVNYSISSKTEEKEGKSTPVISNEMVILRRMISQLESEASETIPPSLKPSVDELNITESEKKEFEALLESGQLSVLGVNANEDLIRIFKSNMNIVKSDLKMNEKRILNIKDNIYKKKTEIENLEDSFRVSLEDIDQKETESFKKYDELASLVDKEKYDLDDANQKLKDANYDRTEAKEDAEMLFKDLKDKITESYSEYKIAESNHNSATTVYNDKYKYERMAFKNMESANKFTKKFRRAAWVTLSAELNVIIEAKNDASSIYLEKLALYERYTKENDDAIKEYKKNSISFEKNAQQAKKEADIVSRRVQTAQKNLVSLVSEQDLLLTLRDKTYDMEEASRLKGENDLSELDGLLESSLNKKSELEKKLIIAEKEYDGEIERVRIINEELEKEEEARLQEEIERKRIDEAAKQAEIERVERLRIEEERMVQERRAAEDRAIAQEKKEAEIKASREAEDKRIAEEMENLRLEAEKAALEREAETERILAEEKLQAEIKRKKIEADEIERLRMETEKAAIEAEAKAIRDEEARIKASEEEAIEEARMKEEARMEEEFRINEEARMEEARRPKSRVTSAGVVKTIFTKNEDGSSMFNLNMPSGSESDNIVLDVSLEAGVTLESYNSVVEKIQDEGTIKNLTKSERDIVSKAGEVFNDIKKSYIKQRRENLLKAFRINSTV